MPLASDDERIIYSLEQFPSCNHYYKYITESYRTLGLLHCTFSKLHSLEVMKTLYISCQVITYAIWIMETSCMLQKTYEMMVYLS